MANPQPSQTEPVCEHADVRYFEDENGAVACMDCGRLFGHLIGETFRAHNPKPPLVPRCYFCSAENPTCYVRWWNTMHYGFLCADHLTEHGAQVAVKYPVAYGVERLEGLHA